MTIYKCNLCGKETVERSGYIVRPIMALEEFTSNKIVVGIEINHNIPNEKTDFHICDNCFIKLVGEIHK